MAKFLEVKGKEKGENKMQPGTRSDQQPPIRKGQLHPDNPAPPNKNKVKPEVQQLADSLNIDVASVRGTGTNGSITLKDVRDHHTASTKKQPEGDHPISDRNGFGS